MEDWTQMATRSLRGGVFDIAALILASPVPDRRRKSRLLLLMVRPPSLDRYGCCDCEWAHSTTGSGAGGARAEQNYRALVSSDSNWMKLVANGSVKEKSVREAGEV